MKTATLFDQYLPRQWTGSRFDHERFSDGTRRVFEDRISKAEYLIARAKDSFPNLPPIEFGITDCPRVGAWAFGDKDHGFIAYASGAEFFPMLLFNRMLADRNLLPRIGDASVERSDLPCLNGIVGQPDMDTMGAQCLVVREPRDPVRRTLAAYLRYLVAEFVVTHELAHIAMGHILYAKKHLNVTCISDPGVPTNDKEKALVWQTLEIYADNWAASHQLHMLCHRISTHERMPPPLGGLHSDPKQALYYWLFALFVFTRLFGDQRLVGVDLSKGDHPPWRFRLRQIGSATLTSLTHWKTEDLFGPESEVKELIVDCLHDVEYAMSVATGEEPSFQGLIDGNDRAVFEHKDRLMQIWKRGLRDKLLEYSYVPLGD